MPAASDLAMLDGDELTSRLGESRRELFNLRFQLATGQLDNPSRISQVKREVARMLTVLRAREILEAEGAYVAPTAAEHEAARIAMTRHVKRGGKVWIRVFPDKPVTQKPAETRMGSGKGNPELWVAVVHPGRVLFELAGVDEELARAAMERAIQKLPFKARFVVRPGTHGHAEVAI